MLKRKTVTMMTVLAFLLTMIFSMAAFAEDAQTAVRDFPGWKGSGTKQTGPVEGSVSDDCWPDDTDESDGGPDARVYKKGWRYSPAGWWFQKNDGTWMSGGWKYIDSRWYVFNGEGHLLTGWYTDENGNKFYLNPVDDGTFGSMRIGWQIIDGKIYYFNTMSDGNLGRLLVNTTTPDGYHIGGDGVMIP